jgi:hypothetical protein
MMSNTDPTEKYWEGSHVLTMNKQFLLLIIHPCHVTNIYNPVKVLSVLEERKYLLKMEKIHCNLR